MPSTELQDLTIDEVSGVDTPANGTPGWLVIKSEDGAVAATEAQLATLYASIHQAQSLEAAPEGVRKAAEELAEYVEKQLSVEDTEDVPLITKMRNIFRRQRDAEVTPTEKAKAFPPKDDGDDDDDDGDEDDVKKVAPAPAAPAPDVEEITKALHSEVVKTLEPVVDDIDTLREALVKALDRIENLEDMVVGSEQAYGQETAEPVAKEYTLRDAILSAAAGNRVTIN